MNPQHENTIYVSKYSQGTTAAQLQKTFSDFGPITQTIPHPNQKGMLITFSTKEAVLKALERPIQLNNTYLSVSQYLDWEKLDQEANVFIENVDAQTTNLSLKNLLSKYGEILSIKINMSDRAGVAYIQFDKKESAEKCIADQATHGLKVCKYSKKKQTNQIIRDQLYVSEIRSSLSNDQLKTELQNHFAEFGPIDTIQTNQNQKCQYAFIKFQRPEDAVKALRSTKQFLKTQLQVEWVVSGTDKEFEANLLTKNLKLSVTEDQLREAYNKIVPVEDIKILKTKTIPRNQQPSTQKAYIYLRTVDDGKKVIDQAYRTPEVFALYEMGTVQLTAMVSSSEYAQFLKMKLNNKKPLIDPRRQPYPPNYQNNQQYPPNYNPGYQQNYQPNYHNNHYNHWNQHPNQHQNQHPNQHPNQYPHHNQYQQHQGHHNHRHHPAPPPLPNIQQLQQMYDKKEFNEVKQILGNLLYPQVASFVGPQRAPIITGVLIDFENFSLNEQWQMLTNRTSLDENIKHALEQIK